MIPEDIAPGMVGDPIRQAYETNGAISLECPQCGAQPEEVCERAGHVLKIPHTERLAMAYRTNHPTGRKRFAARQAHLATHRKTFKPGW